jgi:hypothetical protein
VNSNLRLLEPDPVTLTTSDNSFVSNWADKRSCPHFGISVVLRGSVSIAGTLTLQGSNIIERAGGITTPDPGASGTLAAPVTPDDLFAIGGTIAVAGPGSYVFLPAVPIGCRWVRVKYAASASQAANTASVYFNGVFSS